ncbi:sensor histidine kinase [Tuwongella immobilis]|uniref:histidine kinase n=1 Tax=Tuwongella immobilis TaxID=692036 RepID=A0A6C2YKA4_9BACT|nr:HAMP domain-containing sensor histidine kinase [Tuwongella immobilis]VIP01659.1 histidine kinase : PAS domain S-box OS=Microvirga lotononidis GN=MicloDRAFT_00034450 PE=4 SV=1: HATPase_c [Tuwongella immobilis]VTR99065.1 histidine kinase : PAS domain S-box OS=Microvirga lotononidis GN=MicloDRAFT_00034450 PE=4 SV=1: HATPase_c [Tuwongella immobilis]
MSQPIDAPPDSTPPPSSTGAGIPHPETGRIADASDHPSGPLRYVGALLPLALTWMGLVAWLAVTLVDRANWNQQSDRSNLIEWLTQTSIFRKPLPDLATDWSNERRKHPDEISETALDLHREMIREHLNALVDPTRMFANQLLGFLEMYRIRIEDRSGINSGSDSRLATEIEWKSQLPVPRRQGPGQVQDLEIALGNQLVLSCSYRMHVMDTLETLEQQRRLYGWLVMGLVVSASVLGAYWIYRFLSRERRRELAALQKSAELEHRDREMLQMKLEAAQQEGRAADAERRELLLRSNLFASIGVMAGSYAHNIKNLLVRPNDLLTRCMGESNLQESQVQMLQEVRQTLNTVTDRLQEILRTVRRDPSQVTIERLDLVTLNQDIVRNWETIAREKWRVDLYWNCENSPIWVAGDRSHLLQAIENLIFNSRDAFFQMRKHIRDQADSISDRDQRRKAVLAAVEQRGRIEISLKRDADTAILTVRDNGIGMTPDVLARCTEPHFSTKRDNAIFQGLSSGMGLGLSFVAMTLEKQNARMEIESQPLQGTTFRLIFPLDSTGS